MKVNMKVYRAVAKGMLGIVILLAVCIIGFLALQLSGKNRLYSTGGRTGPDLTMARLPDIDTELLGAIGGGQASEEQEGDWQEGDIRYQGRIYRYNQDMLVFLFMGIDKMTEVEPVKNGIDGGRSDAIFLLTLNPHSREISVIGIPRDTMTEIAVYNEEGRYTGTTNAQICLQHGFGDGAAASCERSREAVAKLFYNLPIHGYCAINMGAIPLINDAVGGVELTALEDVKGKGFFVKAGETVQLKGMSAYYYLHNRDINAHGSAVGRLERQKQYITLYGAKAMEEIQKDITLALSLYGTLSRYMVTDVGLDELSYLAMQASEYRFDSENMYSLEGTVTKGAEYEEFYVDEKALYELILKVFYEEVQG